MPSVLITIHNLYWHFLECFDINWKSLPCRKKLNKQKYCEISGFVLDVHMSWTIYKTRISQGLSLSWNSIQLVIWTHKRHHGPSLWSGGIVREFFLFVEGRWTWCRNLSQMTIVHLLKWLEMVGQLVSLYPKSRNLKVLLGLILLRLGNVLAPFLSSCQINLKME